MASSLTKVGSSDSFHKSSLKSLGEDRSVPKGDDNGGYPIATYSSSYNKHLPQLLLDRLAQMPPQKFLMYILNKLSSFQLDELLLDEKQRIKTFLTNWPHANNGHLSGVKMAQAGFYYLNEDDKVQCVFCKIRLYNWKDDDEAMSEHARASSFCKFVKGFHCGNRPHHIRGKKSTLTAQALEAEGTAVYSLPNGFQNVLDNFDYLGIVSNNLHNRSQAPTQTRMNSFKKWPQNSPVTAPSLYEAGFYSTQNSDEVKCFCCGGKLKGWKDGNEPWLEHAKWFPYCLFLLEIKGQKFIDEVHQSTPFDRKGEYSPQYLDIDSGSKPQVSSINEDMIEVCLALGHSQDTIDKALAFNKKPFSEIKYMIDVLHDIETGELEVELDTSPPQDVQVTIDIEIVEPTEDKFQMGCRVCARNDKYKSANHIGLPCGHLIFCDDCSTKAKLEAENSSVMCPYPGCTSHLLGSRKIYFA